MASYYERIIGKIKEDSPLHAKKLMLQYAQFDQSYKDKFETFFKQYELVLQSQNLTLDYATECYLRLLEDIMYEQAQFLDTGKYSSTSFDEVNARVYGNPEVMHYYLHGLLISEFLWAHHYKTFRFFADNLKRLAGDRKNILEVGGGHGLFTNEVLKQFQDDFNYTMVDVSESSINTSKTFVTGSEKVKFLLCDIVKYEPIEKYDFIIMGEVLEHVEDPLFLMKRLNEIGTPNARAFITAPTNAPTIDHIYLFRSSGDIRKIYNDAGWDILEDKEIYSEDENSTPNLSEVTMIYAAFIQKKNK